MSTYPDNIYEHRELENLPGIEYDVNDSKTLYAEDITKLGDEVAAIETTLGTDVAGEYDTVGERLDNMSGGGGGALELLGTYTPTTAQREFDITDLDIRTHKHLIIYYDIGVATGTARFSVYGTYGENQSVRGVRATSSGVTSETNVDYVAHESHGHGIGRLEVIANDYYHYTWILDQKLGERAYDFKGHYNDWYFGYGEFKTLRFYGATSSNYITTDSVVRVYKVAQ